MGYSCITFNFYFRTLDGFPKYLVTIKHIEAICKADPDRLEWTQNASKSGMEKAFDRFWWHIKILKRKHKDFTTFI